jgi:hypothetical protein
VRKKTRAVPGQAAAREAEAGDALPSS